MLARRSCFVCSSCQLVALVALIFSTGCRNSSEAEVTVEQSGVTISGDAISFDPEDWPCWRGPTGMGIVEQQELPTTWSKDQGLDWSVDIPGRGHGSPIVVNEVVYLATALEDEEKQLVLAYDASTGDQLWEKVIHEGGFTSDNDMHTKSTHANGTIACDGDRIFIAFLNRGNVMLTALSLDGDQEWQTNTGSFRPQFGYAPSPILYRSAVILAADHQGGGYLVAVDRESGEIAWRNTRPKISSYSSALIANVDGTDQLLICGCERLASYDPQTGETNWICPATTSGTCGTVVTDGTRVFAAGGFPVGQTVCVMGDGSKEIAWSNNTRLYEPSLIYTDGLLFGVTDDGIAHCWDPVSGEEHWKARLGGNFSASPISCNGMIYVSNLNGTTFVFEANSSGCNIVAENRIGSDIYTSLAVSKGAIFIRAGHRTNDGRVERLHRVSAVENDLAGTD